MSKKAAATKKPVEEISDVEDVDDGEEEEKSFLEDQNIVTKYKTAADMANVRSFTTGHTYSPSNY